MEIFFEKLSSYGTGPVLLVLLFLLGWVIRELKENSKRDEERADKLASSMNEKMEAMETRFEERFAASDRKVDDLSIRISCVERDYLPREEHYKEFSGWRAEINRLYDLIVDLFKNNKEPK